MWKLNQIKDLEKIAKDIKPSFSGFSIVPTFRCDCRCQFCHTWGNNGWALKDTPIDTKQEIDYDLLCGFIRQAVEHNKNNDNKLSCTISGGEPLLYSRFDDLVYFMKHEGISVGIITNATLLKKHVKALLDNVDTVAVSLSGPPEINDEVRKRENHFEDACAGVEALLKEKIKNNRIYPHVMINLVLSKYTQDYIQSFIDILKKRFKDLGTSIHFDYEIADDPDKLIKTQKDRLINGITIMLEPLLYTTKEQGMLYEKRMKHCFNVNVTSSWTGFLEDNIDMNIPKLKTCLDKIFKENNVDDSSFVDLDEYFSNVTSTFGRTRCLTPWLYMRIRPDGSVNFCSDLPDYLIGNMNTQSFEEIWLGECAEKFREVLRKELMPMCYRCDGLLCLTEMLYLKNNPLDKIQS